MIAKVALDYLPRREQASLHVRSGIVLLGPFGRPLDMTDTLAEEVLSLFLEQNIDMILTICRPVETR